MEVEAAITWEGLCDALFLGKYKILVRARWLEPSEKEFEDGGDFADDNENFQRT